ncbi:tetratricopeptide repeat protein [Deinococcus sp.]|uniref:tetratricopeptide repeat protein n=1 Tax=Deinococcus sp. TaxID=47478 RepID=UPI0025C5C4B6|nr:tetratricopeptide repeat protein [Deinococcus sp.]
MTDSVAEAQPAVSSPDTTSPGDLLGTLPDWSTFARQHDWRRAQAAASLAHLDPALVGAVSSVSTVQEEVRGRRYAAARRALTSYTGHLSDLDAHSAGDAALLRSLAAPEQLREGLEALEAASDEPEAQALAERLGAAQHALIRAEALNLQGVLEALQGHRQPARDHFERAVEHDPVHYRARMNLGNLALENGDPAQAEAQFREVLKLAPDYEGVHHNLGVALRRQGKLHQSVSSIRKAQRLSVRRSQEEAREEVREQLRTDPRIRRTRNIVLGVLAGIFVLIYLLGRGH